MSDAGASLTGGEAVSLHGLMYVGLPDEKHVNIPGSVSSATRVYLRNAVLLARSAAAAGMDFTLLTNDAAAIERMLGEIGQSGIVRLRELEFRFEVPQALRFRSAHHKLEVIGAFAKGDFGGWPLLVDLDCVVLERLSPPPGTDLWALDISDHRWGAGSTAPRRAHRCIEQLAGTRLDDPRWFGGEFVGGPADRLALLWHAICSIWPHYLADLDNMHHWGDEMVLSAALNRLRATGLEVTDAGEAGVVGRWWSTRFYRPEPPLEGVITRKALHLPADKLWLARRSAKAFCAETFRRAYRREARKKLWIERGKLIGDHLLRRVRRPILPRLV